MPTFSIPQLIESCGICRADEVEALRTMKTGMTPMRFLSKKISILFVFRVKERRN